MMKTNKTTLAVMIASCFGAGLAMAEEAQESAKVLSPVVVTATRVEQDAFDLPVSIDKVEKKDIQSGQLRMTLSESLVRIPGLTAQNRNQMAQDPQISTRGFGARSAFGVRGIRLFVDGIPLSMPDGIGNPGSIDLGAIESIEVMRGPFSAMYGMSSGGVIQMFTENASDKPEVEADVLHGSFGTRKGQIKASGKSGGVDYLLSYSDYESDGFRKNSANDKKQATARLVTDLAESTKLTTLINWFDQNAQDPGGLVGTGTSTSDPNAYTTPNGVFQGFLDTKTRVARSNTQIGLNVAHKFDANNSANFIVNGGQRDNKQFLYLNSSSPIKDLNNTSICTSSTGVLGCGRASTIDRQYYGTELNGTNKGEWLSKPYTLTAGLTYGQMIDKRLDVYARNGVEQPINMTNLNRDETQKARTIDQYVQTSWAAAERFDLHAGVRRSSTTLNVIDNITQADNTTNSSDTKFNDASGRVTYTKTTPVVGTVFKVNPTLNLYANFGRAFESPTLVEASYKTTSGDGPNLSLKPSSSENFEIGSKWMATDATRVNVALFDITTNSEIIASANSSGRVVYSNAPVQTKRNGAELSIATDITNSLTAYAAYTLLNATFDGSFTASTTPGATATVNKGNKIPGTYGTQFYAELAWRHSPVGFVGALESRYNSRIYANDTNTASAPSYTVVNLRGSFQQKFGTWTVTEYARIENIFDKSYIGSVRINEYSGARYYEPAPGRNYIVGIKANYAF